MRVSVPVPVLSEAIPGMDAGLAMLPPRYNSDDGAEAEADCRWSIRWLVPPLWVELQHTVLVSVRTVESSQARRRRRRFFLAAFPQPYMVSLIRRRDQGGLVLGPHLLSYKHKLV